MNCNAILFVISFFAATVLSARLDNAYFTPQVAAYSSASASGGYEPLRNQIPILRYSSDNTEDGNYRYAYETGNGIAVQENGHISGSVPEGAAVVADGAYSYTGTDGQTYSISYTADENGFRPVGAHIPTPPPLPPLPEAVARTLAENALRANDGDDGQYRPVAGNRY